MSPPDDVSQGVIRQLMDGRNWEENFRCLFEKYYHAVSSFFFHKRLSSEDRRDLTQEVFVAVHQGIKNLRSEEAFLPWLFSIANHVALRYWERQRSRPRLEVEPDAESEDQKLATIEQIATTDPDPEAQILDSEKVRAVRKILEELPSQMRKCLKGRIYEGLTNIEIARRLGISESTVAVHVHRGIETLRTRLDQYFEKQPFAGNF